MSDERLTIEECYEYHEACKELAKAARKTLDKLYLNHLAISTSPGEKLIWEEMMRKREETK